MLGIVLIALAAIIGIGFGIFAVSKNTANSGASNLQDSINRVNESFFDDYNQKRVTGAQVKMCLQQLQGKPYAIIVHTLQSEGNRITTTAHTQVLKWMNPGDSYNSAQLVKNALLSVDGITRAGYYRSDSGKYWWANAKLGIANGFNTTSNGGQATLNSSLSATNHLVYENDVYKTNYTFWSVKGNVQYDTDFTSFNTVGDSCYIANNSKFKANLMYNLSNNIVGIVFVQLKD